MTSICLPNFVLLALISTILHVFRTIFLYYKVGGGGAGGGVGWPRNNNVQRRPVRRAWIFLAGGSYLSQKSSTVLSEQTFGTPNKKSLGLPLVRGQNVLNSTTPCTFLRPAIIFIAICRFLQLDFNFLSSNVLQVIQKIRHFHFLQRLACSCYTGTSCTTSCTCIILRLYCTVPRVKMNHGVGCRLSWQSTLYQYIVYMWPVSAVCLQPFF